MLIGLVRNLYQSDSSQRRSLRSCLGAAHDEFVTREIILVQFLDSPFYVGNPYFVFQITIREPLGSHSLSGNESKLAGPLRALLDALSNTQIRLLIRLCVLAAKGELKDHYAFRNITAGSSQLHNWEGT